MADKIQDCAVNSTRWLSLENFEGEVWKDVDGYEGGYQVSNLGRAKSLRRRILIKSKIGTPSYRDYGERILQAHDNQKGYLYVNIGGRNGEQIYIHRLVAKAFVPNPNGKPEIDHANTNRKDNRFINLKWVSKVENRRNPITYQKGKIAQSEPVVVLDFFGNYLYECYGAQYLADLLQVSRGSIESVIHRESSRSIRGLQFVKKADYNPSKNYSLVGIIKKSSHKDCDVPTLRMVTETDTNGNVVRVFPNTTQAAEFHRLSISCVSKRCRTDHGIKKFEHTSTRSRNRFYYYKDLPNCLKGQSLKVFFDTINAAGNRT